MAGLERLVLFLCGTDVVLLSVFMFGQSISKRALLARAISYGGIGIASLHDIETTGIFLKEAAPQPAMTD